MFAELPRETLQQNKILRRTPVILHPMGAGLSPSVHRRGPSMWTLG